MQALENRPYDELAIGETAALTRELERFGPSGLKNDIIELQPGASAWAGLLLSHLIETQLPGLGTITLTQTLTYGRPDTPSGAITATLAVREKRSDGHVVLDFQCSDPSGAILVHGWAEVVAPREKLRRAASVSSSVKLHTPGARYRAALEKAQGLPPIRTAVVHSVDEASLRGAVEAADAGLIVPILVGPAARIAQAAEAAGLPLGAFELIDVPHSHAAAEKSVALVREGQVEALMKGALHTDELMGAVVASGSGLKTERRISHIFALDVPSYHKPLFITDAAINIYPTLDDKRDIVQNAIELCVALGIDPPKVAILSATEMVHAKISSTVEAAALCKMAERGQITGGLLDGPLAFDNAISKEAAAAKHIASSVAGDADILLAPDLESGNMIAKQLIYLAGADAAGLVLGARVPIMLTSRADGALARVASCALAQIFIRSRLSRAL